jgi:hypothetical protein
MSSSLSRCSALTMRIFESVSIVSHSRLTEPQFLHVVVDHGTFIRLSYSMRRNQSPAFVHHSEWNHADRFRVKWDFGEDFNGWTN